ncbi:hypothetical protein D3C81_1096330 [compost metagenome]
MLRIGAGQRDQLPGFGEQVRAPGATTHRQQNGLSDLEVADVGGDFQDLAHAFIAADGGQGRQHAVFAGQGEHIGGVDGGCQHFHQYLAGANRWQLKLHGFNHVLGHRATGLVFGFEHDASPGGLRGLESRP